MAEAISWCRTCGKNYKSCHTCVSNRNKYFSYKLLCCSAIHYQIYQIVCDYLNGVITKSKARELLLANPDFNEVEVGSYIDAVKYPLFEILYDNNKPAKRKTKARSKE